MLANIEQTSSDKHYRHQLR